MMRMGVFLVIGCLCACTDEPAQTTGGEPVAVQAPVDRDAWWTQATKRRSGTERILAPRELRALVAEARTRGFDQDSEWWSRRAAWAYERILTLDPEDVEANRGSGRRTLRSVPGFDKLWVRMINATVQSAESIALLDQYGPAVESGKPVFLYESEFEQEHGRLRAIARHLDKLDADPGYAAEQRAIASVRTSHLGDYPFLELREGPFLIFYSARDLQRIPGEDEVAERDRLDERKETYRKRLRKWVSVYSAVLDDVKKLYPAIWKDYPIGEGVLFRQWIFSEPGSYADVMRRLRAASARTPYRHGFFHAPTGWAYMAEPADPEEGGPAETLEETAAYLAARQLMRYWARDPKDRLVNHLDRSEAYWFKEGWPSFVAARRVKASSVGPLLTQVKNAGTPMPELIRVLERRSIGEHPSFFLGSAPGQGDGFTDMACLLVRHLHGEKHKPAFDRFLRSRLDGSRRGIDWFEDCFGVKDAAWRGFERAVYQGIKSGR